MKMKNLKLLLLSAISFTSIANTTLPLKAEIKENHFRFENFKRDKSSNLEYVHLMCYQKRPTTWAEPKQYLSGEHDLWVKASISKRNISQTTKEAFVNFKVKLKPGKSYMLNRETVDDKMSIWIQEVDTGLGVSDVMIADLKKPLIFDESMRKRQCESGSV
jgi:type IV secretory pathway ATPase VirB11/archaellum biosynthesis ATPase